MRHAVHLGFQQVGEVATVLLRASVVSAAFSEGPAFMGFVSFLLGGGMELLALYCGVSFLAIVAVMPTAGRVAMMIEDARLHQRG